MSGTHRIMAQNKEPRPQPPAFEEVSTTPLQSASPKAAEPVLKRVPMEPVVGVVRAPMLGTFHCAPAPNADPYIKEACGSRQAIRCA